MRGNITTLTCGDFVLVHKRIYASGYIKRESKKSRSPKHSKTTKKQAVVNEKQAADKLLALIHTNFEGGDLHIIPTYEDKNYPYNTEKLKKEHANFIRRLKYAYKKVGAELKYIQVTEYEAKRPHHHYIINSVKGISIDDIQAIWGNGLVRCTPLERGGYYKKLADYLIKETSKTFSKENGIYGKRWTASKNLKQPEKHTETVKIKNENEFLTAPLFEDDYQLVKGSEYIGVNEYTGLPYAEYAMRRIKPYAGKNTRRQKKKNGHLTEYGRKSS